MINYFILSHCLEWIDLIGTDQGDNSIQLTDSSAMVFERKGEILKPHVWPDS